MVIANNPPAAIPLGTPPAFRFSQHAQHLKRSVMRDLLKHAVDPQMISLAGGLPAAEALPLRQYQDCLNHVLVRDGAKAMQYAPPYLPLKQWLAGYMQARGVNCDTDNIFITGGNQQGLAILARLFLDAGALAVIESAVFTGVQQITAGMGAKIIAVPTDLDTGINTDALEKAFKRQPRLAVVIPDFHNPLGVSISAHKRRHIAALAAEYQVPVIEDDPYSPLRFAGEMLPPIKAHDDSDYVFYLGSFSKLLAPGLRLGWLVAPPELIPKITVIREALDLESSTLTQRAVHEFLQRDYLPAHLQQLNALNQRRQQALATALDTHLSDIAHWTTPTGGLFIWLTLPEQMNTWDMLPDAIEKRVVYIPGAAFAVHDDHHNAMRLNFSSVPEDKFDEAISRLAQVIKRYI